MAPVIPFIASDGLVHRVAADTQPTWIYKNLDKAQVNLLTQCGLYGHGHMHPEGSRVVNCLACAVTDDVPEATDPDVFPRLPGKGAYTATRFRANPSAFYRERGPR